MAISTLAVEAQRAELRAKWRTVEVEELAVEADAVLAAGPEQPQNLDRLVGATATGGEVDTHGPRLSGQAAQSHSEQPHPPRRDLVALPPWRIRGCSVRSGA